MSRELRVGFEVPKWSNKNPKDFTNEELLEYWRMLRVTCKSGPFTLQSLSTNEYSSYAYVVELQDEILRRMGNKE